MLIKGWSTATLRQRNTSWATALVSQCDWQQIHGQLLSELMGVLPPQQQEQILTTKIPTKREDLMIWLDQVAKASHTWSLDFSYLVLEQVFKTIKLTDRKGYGLNYLIKELAIVLHPELTPVVAAAIKQFPDNNPQFYWIQGALDQLYARMSFRLEMYQAFNPSG